MTLHAFLLEGADLLPDVREAPRRPLNGGVERDLALIGGALALARPGRHRLRPPRRRDRGEVLDGGIALQELGLRLDQELTEIELAFHGAVRAGDRRRQRRERCVFRSAGHRCVRTLQSRDLDGEPFTLSFDLPLELLARGSIELDVERVVLLDELDDLGEISSVGFRSGVTFSLR